MNISHALDSAVLQLDPGFTCMLDGGQLGAMEVVQAAQHGPAPRTSYAVSLRNLMATYAAIAKETGIKASPN